MPTIDYLPVATGVGANVDSQANFNGAGYQTGGFSAGLAQSKQANKVWRQASMAVVVLATFISNVLGIDMLDDGIVANFVNNFKNALTQWIATGGASGQTVAFSATPVFDASKASTFQITLTGNVTGSTLSNVQPYQRLTFIIKEDAVGGRTFVPPANLPLADIATGANNVNVQQFQADAAGTVYPASGMTQS